MESGSKRVILFIVFLAVMAASRFYSPLDDLSGYFLGVDVDEWLMTESPFGLFDVLFDDQKDDSIILYNETTSSILSGVNEYWCAIFLSFGLIGCAMENDLGVIVFGVLVMVVLFSVSSKMLESWHKKEKCGGRHVFGICLDMWFLESIVGYVIGLFSNWLLRYLITIKEKDKAFFGIFALGTIILLVLWLFYFGYVMAYVFVCSIGGVLVGTLLCLVAGGLAHMNVDVNAMCNIGVFLSSVFIWHLISDYVYDFMLHLPRRLFR